MKKRVLILCTGNSCRSQMAEGFWRHYGGDEWEVHSAGLHPMGVNRMAIAAMRELGIEISGQQSQFVGEFVDQSFDLVITVCDHAARACPSFPGAGEKLHWPFDDPIDVSGTEAERLESFRRVRDEIGATIREWLGHSA